MAACSWCPSEMTSAVSCTVDAFHRNGRRFDMTPFGDEDGPDASHLLVEPLGVDGNGLPTELMWLGEQQVVIHRDDVPDTDVATVDGIRCTTALRTVIDIAPDVSAAHLAVMVQDCLERELFTVEEAWRRLADPDMTVRRGAELLRRVLPPTAA